MSDTPIHDQLVREFRAANEQYDKPPKPTLRERMRARGWLTTPTIRQPDQIDVILSSARKLP